MESSHELLILAKNPSPYASLVRQAGLPGLVHQSVRDVSEASLFSADLVLGEPAMAAKIIHRLPGLKWIQSIFAGVEPLLKPGLPTHYLLTSAKGIFSRHMAEYVMAYLLAHERDLFAVMDNQRKKTWKPIRRMGVAGLCLGICGPGSIGRHIARVAKAFGMKVAVFRKHPGDVPGADNVFWGGDFHAFLAMADHVVSVLPHTPQTAGMFDAAAFSAMKKTALFMNVGRGGAVDETALVHALEAGQIAGAVLDVFQNEPLDENSPLWRVPNLIITPHHAAVTSPEKAFAIFLDNYRRFVENKALKFQVDFNLGY